MYYSVYKASLRSILPQILPIFTYVSLNKKGITKIYFTNKVQRIQIHQSLTLTLLPSKPVSILRGVLKHEKAHSITHVSKPHSSQLMPTVTPSPILGNIWDFFLIVMTHIGI